MYTTTTTGKHSERQSCHISFLAQFIHTVEHIDGTRNVIPDALSRLEVACSNLTLPDLKQFVADQALDSELQKLFDVSIPPSCCLIPQLTEHGTVYYVDTKWRQFEPDLFGQLMTSFGIRRLRSSPYHAQANGLVERFHRPLKVAFTAHDSPQ